MKFIKGLLFLFVAVLVMVAIVGVYYVSGWILSLLVNPILLNFDLNPITPFIGALILAIIDWFVRMIKR